MWVALAVHASRYDILAHQSNYQGFKPLADPSLQISQGWHPEVGISAASPTHQHNSQRCSSMAHHLWRWGSRL